MKLVEMLGSIKILKLNIDFNVEIKDIKYDSKEIEKDDVFVAISGGTADGHSYIYEAMAKGAACIVCERPPEKADVPFVQVEDSRKALAVMAKNYFGCPDEQLHITGVTGTNGKTSTTHFLHHILTEGLGRAVGLIGTNQNITGDKITPSKNTTPQSYEIFRMMREMVMAGCTHCVMEVSSHALDQQRVYGIEFDTGVFTNLTHDHLDYHITFENYKNAKLKLAAVSRINIVNADDTGLADALPHSVSYSIRDKNADAYAENITNNGGKTRFDLMYKGKKRRISIPVPGMFTVYNGMAAALAALVYGLTFDDICRALNSVKAVTGRCEYVDCGQPFDVMIDFAHTPDGMKSVLSSARQMTKGRLITVFGCGGNRDRTKRPVMGRIAAEYSDKVIITSDNARYEKPIAIIRDILDGIEDGDVDMICDRKKAIHHAMDIARKGDLVMLLGKGHELYNEKNGERTYFDEREIVKAFKT